MLLVFYSCGHFSGKEGHYHLCLITTHLLKTPEAPHPLFSTMKCYMTFKSCLILLDVYHKKIFIQMSLVLLLRLSMFPNPELSLLLCLMVSKNGFISWSCQKERQANKPKLEISCWGCERKKYHWKCFTASMGFRCVWQTNSTSS